MDIKQIEKLKGKYGITLKHICEHAGMTEKDYGLFRAKKSESHPSNSMKEGDLEMMQIGTTNLVVSLANYLGFEINSIPDQIGFKLGKDDLAYYARVTEGIIRDGYLDAITTNDILIKIVSFCKLQTKRGNSVKCRILDGYLFVEKSNKKN